MKNALQIILLLVLPVGIACGQTNSSNEQNKEQVSPKTLRSASMTVGDTKSTTIVTTHPDTQPDNITNPAANSATQKKQAKTSDNTQALDKPKQ